MGAVRDFRDSGFELFPEGFEVERRKYFPTRLVIRLIPERQIELRMDADERRSLSICGDFSAYRVANLCLSVRIAPMINDTGGGESLRQDS